MAHGRLTMRRDRRLEMFAEIREKCERYMASHPGCRLPEALGYVLASESASQFFIAEATAVRLVQRLRSGAWRERRAG